MSDASEQLPAVEQQKFNEISVPERDSEKLEEVKAKFPIVMSSRGGPAAHSAFLQKRLTKGKKFFDSGDYQMAKQRPGTPTGPFKVPFPVKGSTGNAIPTPDTVSAKKSSNSQSKLPLPVKRSSRNAVPKPDTASGKK